MKGLVILIFMVIVAFISKDGDIFIIHLIYHSTTYLSKGYSRHDMFIFQSILIVLLNFLTFNTHITHI